MASLTLSDLNFVLAQIKIAEDNAAGTPLTSLIASPFQSLGLRTVDGSLNNLVAGQSGFGAADNNFAFMLGQVWRVAQDNPNTPAPTLTSYAQTTGNVYDADPRVISNLIVDQTANNPASVVANGGADPVMSPGLDGVFGTADDVPVFFIPNTTPDEGLSAPFNSWMTLFGQFFDHGLDLINKGGNGSVRILLNGDDPLYNKGADNTAGTLDDLGADMTLGTVDDPFANFMTVTRATVTATDNRGTADTSDDIHYFKNQTTPFVDQNQTYTSHASHQAFLREYVRVGNQTLSTGHLLDGETNGLPTWAEIKAQAATLLGIQLTDADILNVPLLRTDAYGNLILGPTGYAQIITNVGADGIPNTADDLVVQGNPAGGGVLTTGALRTSHAFLDDIAHTAAPAFSAPGVLAPDGDDAVGYSGTFGPQGNNLQYDDELLDAHFITGDGRGNENIGLTTVHHVFHSEHNRQVEEIKGTLIAGAVASGNVATLNEWLRVDVANVAAIPANLSTLAWDGARLFQAARFATEMQYQHLVFEEFARKVSPQIDAFLAPIGYDTTIDSAIVSEFANVVYRFGHSMLTETIDRYDPNFNIIDADPLHPLQDGSGNQIGLIAAFLNPLAFTASDQVGVIGNSAAEAAGAIVRGMTRQAGNEIDEFVTEALRNNLVGLPLDLPAINIARGRDAGVPTLNEARRQFFEMTEDSQLAAYTSWVDFAAHLKHEASVINFIAAYGTHASITGATTLADKRAAAVDLVIGGGAVSDVDRLAFLNGPAATTGVNAIDLWIGGLAEKQMPFGGLLGSTFNFVFETQLENLQNGDRFYYLARTAGLEFAAALENNSFAKLIMANTDATHLPGDVFTTPTWILEVNQAAQFTGLGSTGPLDPGRADPTSGNALIPLVIRDNPQTAAVETNYLRYTGEDHVVLGGTAGNDTLISGIGDDTIYGDGGNDRIEGGDGVDTIMGGAGDDIITDLGGDDVIHGEAGNDVIHGGNGLNILFGHTGHDFIITGEDVTTTFAGAGNDFVLGSSRNLETIGGEGDDWLEFGHQEGSVGDNFDGAGLDLVKGHDVFIGGGAFEDIIAEGGDDIIFGSDGQEKMDGASGFDWAGYKFAVSGVTVDMKLQIANATPATPSTFGQQDLFAFVEGLSGTAFADVLRGDDLDATGFATAGAQGSVLDAAGIARIAGLGQLLGTGVTSFRSGNIMLGGDGSDLIEGRQGDDLIDGDRWLDATISVRDATNHAVELFRVDSMRDIMSQMLDGTLNPGQLEIVREIKTAAGPDYDTAVYSGVRANYDVGVAFDGTVTVRDLFGTLAGNEGTDTLRNIERLQFADQALAYDPATRTFVAPNAATATLNSGPTGALQVNAPGGSPNGNELLTVTTGNVADANIVGGSIAGRPVTFYWQVERPGINGGGDYWEDIVILNGLAGAPTALTGATVRLPESSAGFPLQGAQIRARAVYQDGNGVLENVFSAATTAVGAPIALPAAPVLPAEAPTQSAGVHLIRSDLQFMLDQIVISEQHAAGQNLLTLVGNERNPLGLRTVDGSFNNLVPGQTEFGASDNPFPLLIDQVFSNDADGDTFDPDGPGPAGLITNTNYASTTNVADADPRTISNLIVDQTVTNPVAYQIAFDPGLNGEWEYGSAGADHIFGTADDLTTDDVLNDNAQIVDGFRADGTPFQTFQFGNQKPDVGLSAPFNSWMTLFGQFFDHGLDLVDKGGNGTVYIPLQPDDPLYIEGGFTNFMVVTRATNMATNAGVDGVFGTADDVHRHNNETTPFIDQNQTYTANASHQVFLREYVLVNHDNNNATPLRPMATGKLLEGANGGIANWAEVKAQAADLLGIQLTDANIFDVPMLVTDEYGKFIPGANGFAQFVTTTGPVQANPAANGGAGTLPPANALFTGHSFLNDIAHNAVPGTVFDTDGNPATPGTSVVAPDNGSVAGNPIATDFAGRKVAYDDELLNAHFITGDGRGNENIGLTSVHFVFHAEHNRLVEHTKDVALASNDVGFLNQWLRVDVANLAAFDTPAERAALKADPTRWDGERLFQAARFATEMQYQHLVFEEFARTVQPQIDLFFAAGQVYDTMLNPAIVAEFAHTVYRFGHSMLTETIDRFDPSFNIIDDPSAAGQQQIGLIAAFLNPLAFTASDQSGIVGNSASEAAGAIIRGMTRQAGNEIDEFVTEALRNNLVGLPLDLPAINIARGRETGVPTLNLARAEFFAMTGDSQLAPYTSWVDFSAHLRHPESVINFIAAYGTHALITAETTLEGKRAAALAIVTGGPVTVFGAPGAADDRVISTPADRLAFLNGPAATTGVNAIDLWIGGLAEAQMPFGGLLGSTFNFVFETQMENLQDGDRFYYLERTAGLNFLTELEGNSFAKLIMANTDATHLPGNVFATPTWTLEVDPTKQFNDTDGDGVLDQLDPTGESTLVPLVTRDALNNYLKYDGVDHVVMGGTSGNDIIISGIGDDTLYGDDGNDRLEGGDGVDMILGGAGDDIITDLGGDDVIQGGDGNDAIQGGNGVNLIIGGFGQDFINSGEDASEMFGGVGNDFLLGSRVNEQDMGNEGDDWLEHGNADGSPGDNFDPFGRDQVIGNDVYIGDTVIDIMNAEGGDDIMVGNGGQQDHYLGASGYDWAVYKDSPTGVILFSDLLFENEATALGVNPSTLDRYQSVEGLSGSQFGDYLVGSDNLTSFFATSGFTGSILTNFALINGLQALVAPARNPALSPDFNANSFSGEILLGGDGSDVLKGGGGNEIIDGDAWLNVQIGVYDNLAHTTLQERFNSMLDLQDRVFSGEINPGRLGIVREIRTTLLDGTPIGRDFDTAVYSGNLADYTMVLNNNGTANTADDYYVVTDVGSGLDGVDIVRNIERFQFADQSVVVGGLNASPVGLLTVSDATPTENQLLSVSSIAGVTDANNVSLANPTGAVTGAVTYYWQVEITGGTFTDILRDNGVTLGPVTGTTFMPSDAEVGMTLRVRAVYKDANDVVEEVFSAPTAPVINVNDLPVGTVLINDTAPTQNQALVASNMFTDADLPIDLVPGVQPPIVYNYQWQRSNNINLNEDANPATNATWANIAGAINATYTPVVADTFNAAARPNVAIRVVVTYIDGQGTSETVTSAPTTRIGINLVGGGGDNTQNGTPYEDWLQGNGGNDTQNGGAGNDILEGGDDNDVVNGGDGNDTITGGAGNDTVSAGAGSDLINYTIGDGTDTVDGGLNVDSLNIAGTAAANTLTVVFNGTALSTVQGGAVTNVETVNADLLGGADTLSYAGTGVGAATVNVTVNLAAGTASGFASSTNIENLIGGSDNDNLTGNDSANTLDGGADNGADTLRSLGGSDSLIGGGGDDILDGGAGNDTMVGGAGNDTYFVDSLLDVVTEVAGGGNDTVYTTIAGFTAANVENIILVGAAPGAPVGQTLVGDGGPNTLTGGAGNDTLIGGGGNDILNGGDGNDTFMYTIGDGADSVDGGAGNDTLIITGTAANNTLDVVFNGSELTNFEGGTLVNVESVSADMLGNGAAGDTLSYVGTTAAVTVNLGASAASGFTSIANIENVTGGSGIDTLIGSLGVNTLSGGDGADTLTGGAGADTVNGDGGNDRFIATLADGNDAYNGGAGVDTYDLSGTTAAATITATTATSAQIGNDTLTSIENVIGSQGADTITLDAVDNLIDGQGGNDTISAGDGADTIIGGAGNDTVNGNDGADRFMATTGDGNDTYNGNAGADTYDLSLTTAGATITATTATGLEIGTDTLTSIANFVGSQGTDTITGNGGANTIDGQAGADTLNGGAGGDTLNGGADGDILIGGADVDTIDTGAANDNILDVIRFSAATEYGDTINNFDANGTVDRVDFGGALNTLFDDLGNNDNFTFNAANAAGNNSNQAVNLNNTIEALILDGSANSGVTTANLGVAGAVATEFNAEFAMTAANGEETLLVINDTAGNSAAIWQWVQTAGGTAEIDVNELALIGIVNANATVGTGSFDFF